MSQKYTFDIMQGKQAQIFHVILISIFPSSNKLQKNENFKSMNCLFRYVLKGKFRQHSTVSSALSILAIQTIFLNLFIALSMTR